ncbi:YcjF family protein [Pararhizobium sp. BT-229]|uniref:YcjF family protein n=1 Tax=Pararhizobium sp. BT-229 TaxID=2986923 RepID=UPI0021F6B938|nr:YcjF family protein [Pararhizobium sp. BT-229]MCV9960575.1 YcjF family protein [Pararhizobium sp. BT-229]
MSDTPKIPQRKPAAFTIDNDAANRPEAARRSPASFDENIVMTADSDDPFFETTRSLPAPPEAAPRKRRFSFGKLAFGALGILVSLALGLWVDSLVRDLFSRADWLGYLAIATAAIGLLAFLIVIIRELVGLMRLNAVQALKHEAIEASLAPSPKPARQVMAHLIHLLAAKPQTARGRLRLKETETDIIDGPHLLDLTERELLSPLDREARALILNASKRVSIVTAVSPRALVDLGYVIYESARLIRAMADLYGGRPGTFGLLRLMRDVIAHLAVTGSIAVGDSLIQQVLGHGLASKLSARLGEGVINGLMTARIGIAAMDLCRPMPFRALKRPGIGDFIGDLAPGTSKAKATEDGG